MFMKKKHLKTWREKESKPVSVHRWGLQAIIAAVPCSRVTRLCSIPGLAELFKPPIHYLASLLEHSAQRGQCCCLNTLLLVKKLPDIAQTCLMLAGKAVVLNCINSEYGFKHRAFFITPEASLRGNSEIAAHYQPIGGTKQDCNSTTGPRDSSLWGKG